MQGELLVRLAEWSELRAVKDLYPGITSDISLAFDGLPIGYPQQLLTPGMMPGSGAMTSTFQGQIKSYNEQKAQHLPLTTAMWKHTDEFAGDDLDEIIDLSMDRSRLAVPGTDGWSRQLHLEDAREDVLFTRETDTWTYDSSEDDSPVPRDRQSGRMPSWSVGAVGHNDGQCKPCAWYWKPGGCSKGEACTCCHLCEEGMLNLRRKEQQAMAKQRFREHKQNRFKAQRGRASKIQEITTRMPIPPGLVPSSLMKPAHFAHS